VWMVLWRFFENGCFIIAYLYYVGHLALWLADGCHIGLVFKVWTFVCKTFLGIQCNRLTQFIGCRMWVLVLLIARKIWIKSLKRPARLMTQQRFAANPT
jgi:hypothetical protein